ncbi:glycoside hydrolase family 19 protein [Vagococcus fluvialis]|uniref:glycoside hydrolase family 19 protein n=1 Tax=Vagococcus fluvialis TaxID=2738 RepID=UPI00379F25F9
MTYKVKSGDTLTAIAKKFGMTVVQLQSLNGLKNADQLQIGQVIKVSSGGGGTSKPTKNYTIKSGDNLSSIAVKFGMTVAQIQSLNGISNPDKISIGQVIKVYGTSTGTGGSTGGNTGGHTSGNGIPGKRVTGDQLSKLGWMNITKALVDDLNSALDRYGITTRTRIIHFISQCAHESGGGMWTKELASGLAYEWRADIGNNVAGDGPKFKGGGFIQLTGRANYTYFGNSINDPEVVRQGVDYVATKYPWTSAGFWWHNNQMNALCDSNPSVEVVTYRVNGGYNGLADRKHWYNKCLEIF